MPADAAAVWDIRVAPSRRLLVARAGVARTTRQRITGLLGRRGLGEHEGLVILDCRAIHTCFMRFAIDAMFVDRAWGVVAIHHALPPWRFTWVAWKAHAVIELPAGTVERAGIRVGDHLIVEPVQGQGGSLS